MSGFSFHGTFLGEWTRKFFHSKIFSLNWGGSSFCVGINNFQFSIRSQWTHRWHYVKKRQIMKIDSWKYCTILSFLFSLNCKDSISWFSKGALHETNPHYKEERLWTYVFTSLINYNFAVGFRDNSTLIIHIIGFLKEVGLSPVFFFYFFILCIYIRRFNT